MTNFLSKKNVVYKLTGQFGLYSLGIGDDTGGIGETVESALPSGDDSCTISPVNEVAESADSAKGESK